MKGHKLKILRVTEYKGFNILVQNYGEFCQFVAFKDGSVYQGYNVITTQKGNKKHSHEDLIKIGTVMLDYAFATCDAIIFKDNPEKLIEANKFGDDIVNILEERKKKEKDLPN